MSGLCGVSKCKAAAAVQRNVLLQGVVVGAGRCIKEASLHRVELRVKLINTDACSAGTALASS